MTITDPTIVEADAAAPGTAPVEAEGKKRKPGRPRKSRTPGAGDTTPRPSAPAAGRGPGRPSGLDKLEEHLTAQFATIGMVAFAFDPRVGAILVEDAGAHGKALAQLAGQNAKVRKFLEGGLTGSAWIGVAVAFGSTGFKIAQAVKAAPDAAPQAPAAASTSPGSVSPLFSSFGTGTDGP